MSKDNINKINDLKARINLLWESRYFLIALYAFLYPEKSPLHLPMAGFMQINNQMKIRISRELSSDSFRCELHPFLAEQEMKQGMREQFEQLLQDRGNWLAAKNFLSESELAFIQSGRAPDSFDLKTQDLKDSGTRFEDLLRLDDALRSWNNPAWAFIHARQIETAKSFFAESNVIPFRRPVVESPGH